MKTLKLFVLLICLLNLNLIYCQEVKIIDIQTEIESQKSVLLDKQNEVDFLTKFISELENSKGDNSNLIKSKREELSEEEIQLLEIKAKIFDLTEKLQRVEKEISTETVPEEITRLETIEREVNTKIAEFNLNEKTKLAFANKTIKYKATIWNTNFTIPIARFNFTKNDDNNKLGEIQLFNSIGAGFGKSWGTMTDYRDATGNLENSDFANSFSIHGGFLFSAGSDDNNVFAPVITFGMLDFQIGFGVELGTIKEDQERVFVTLGYAIPLYKLTKGKYLFVKKGRILNEINRDL